MKKDKKLLFFACLDRFSNFPTAEVFGRSNAKNFLKFLQNYALLHGTSRAIRLNQDRLETGQLNHLYVKKIKRLLKLQFTVTELLDQWRSYYKQLRAV